jgi:phage RecT family recombinase
MSNALILTQQALASPKDLKGVFELEPFKNNFTRNLVKTTQGMNQEKAELIFEREKILFMKAISANKALEQCDRFSIYSAFIELAVSGVSLNEGESYIIPYGKKAGFQVGYKGRVKQMQEIPAFSYVNMPQVVYTRDEFDYVLGEEPKVLKHRPQRKREEGDELEFVYMVIERHNAPSKTYIMTREQVLNIRDHYSQPYIQYMAECIKQGKKPGEKLTKQMTGQNGPYTIYIDPPMWITSPEEAWKKTICKRAYKWVPKTAKMKALDAKIAGNQDPEDGLTEEEAFEIDYGIQNNDGTTTEVKADAAKAARQPKKEKATPTAPEKPAADTATIDDIANVNTNPQPEASNTDDNTQDASYEEVVNNPPSAEASPVIPNPLESF